jgi:hypothetical protein
MRPLILTLAVAILLAAPAHVAHARECLSAKQVHRLWHSGEIHKVRAHCWRVNSGKEVVHSDSVRSAGDRPAQDRVGETPRRVAQPGPAPVEPARAEFP